jgi:hypothetical protein
LWPRFHTEMDEGGGGSPSGLNQSGERKEREWGPDSVQPSGGKMGGGGSVPRVLEQVEGGSVDNGRSQWRRARVEEIGEGAWWWGSGVACGPAR